MYGLLNRKLDYKFVIKLICIIEIKNDNKIKFNYKTIVNFNFIIIYNFKTIYNVIAFL